MKLLLTGFTPFDGETINPALEAVTRVKSEIAGMKLLSSKSRLSSESLCAWLRKP